MHRYVIACEFYRAKRANTVADTIRKLANEWQHPLANLWIVDTVLSAGDIRSLLLSSLDFRDRVYITETGRDVAEFNTQPMSGGKVTHIEQARTKSRMLANIFGRNGKTSRHLMAATSKNLQSA